MFSMYTYNELKKQLENVDELRFIFTSPTFVTEKKSMNSSYSATRTLVLTKSAAFASAATQDGYKELGVERFEILVSLDEKTCETCGSFDGKVFEQKDYAVGVTAPPFHPNCRCTTVPYFDDEFTKGEERAAKDEDGKTYYVPADMKYGEWKEKYVDKKVVNEYKEYKNKLGKSMIDVEEFKKIRYDKNKWREFKEYARSIVVGELTPLADFNLYQEISKNMSDELIGLITSTGVTIKEKSFHSVARVIGSVEQRRNGVFVSDIADALTNEKAEIFPIRTSSNGKTQKFKSEKVEVSINPDTGNVIQVNPAHARKK